MAACLWAFDTFLQPIIGLNVENWASRHGLGDLLAVPPELPSVRPFIGAVWEAISLLYAFTASGYGLSFAAGCILIAFSDWLTWPYVALRNFQRSGGLFGPIRWNFRGFLGMTADDWSDLRVVGFQATGRNRRARPLAEISGCIRSDITGQEVPLQLNIGGDPIPPEQAYSIPGRATFGVVCMLPQHPNRDGLMRGPPAGKFLRQFGGFTFVFQAEGREWNIHFSHEEVAGLINSWRTDYLEKPELPGPTRRI